MTVLTIPDELAKRLEAIAEREQRAVADVLADLVSRYMSNQESEDALMAMDGMFDDDVTDLSSTVRETLDEYYRKKYGSSR